jgi:hypothetical protein
MQLRCWSRSSSPLLVVGPLSASVTPVGGEHDIAQRLSALSTQGAMASIGKAAGRLPKLPQGPAAYPGVIMAHLSDKAQAAQQALRDASARYQEVVASVIEDPRGPFVHRLREAEERVAEAAASWALEYIEGAE